MLLLAGAKNKFLDKEINIGKIPKNIVRKNGKVMKNIVKSVEIKEENIDSKKKSI